MAAINKPIATSKEPTSLAGLSAFQKIFVIGAINVLVISTIVWSLLGAIAQSANADQLINAYLFENNDTFRGSFMPSTHTFLLKWPLFWLIKMLGYSDTAYVAITVAVSLLTVAALAFIAYRLIRKPLPFAILCLVLSSMLLPIPAQPYPGALLPVNMAMLTTRNLEYIVYLVSLLLLIKIPKTMLTSWRFWTSISLLGLLIASDKIFMPLTLGGAGIAWLAYTARRNQQLSRLCLRWLTAGLAGTALAYLILFGVGVIVHTTGSDAASPYGIVHSLHDFTLGVVYAIMNTFTNLGANPAFEAAQAKLIPTQFASRLFGWGGPAYIVNLAAASLGLFAIYKLMRASLARRGAIWLDSSTHLPLMLIWTSLAAIFIYIATDHYYPVDARYLGIILFAVVLTLAIYLRDHEWVSAKLVPISFILLAGIAAGVFVAWDNYQQEVSAMTDMNSRNVRVAAAMKGHAGHNTLLGVYWRVVPIRQASNNSVPILPLSNCTQAREVLSSTAWQPDLQNEPFAYLLSHDPQISDFPNCNLQQIIDKYGEPNASTIISGTHDAPLETLLFYDRGARSNPNEARTSSSATVAPTALDKLARPTCPGKTVLTTIAHQDDDLLFMNPDLLHALRAGDCLRTVYVTAGDAGNGELYWLEREKGAQKAYDYMGRLDKSVWTQQIIRLSVQQYITIASPQDNPNVSLISMRLPDGNPNGSGFEQTRLESLAKLYTGSIDNMSSVDKQSVYRKDDVTSAITKLMDFYQPDEIHTQAPEIVSDGPRDHSDHTAVGRFTQTAYQQRQAQTDTPGLIKYYLGYSVQNLAPNVVGQDYEDKAQAFFAYSLHDGGGCRTSHDCDNRSVYGSYLRRQYTREFPN